MIICRPSVLYVNVFIHVFLYAYFIQIILANENSVLEAEVRTLQRKLQRRDHEIMKQERELHKLRVRKIDDK